MFIDKLKERFDINQPIFSEDILNIYSSYSRAYVFTFFGISTITADEVINKRYLRWDNNVYGIYSGLSLLNFFFVTTQVPNVIEIVTNNETTRSRVINLDGRKFILKSSRFKIDNDNVNVYIILQLFSEIGKSEQINMEAIERINWFIREKNITQQQLLSLSVYFPARTIRNMIRLGILNEIA